MIKIPISDIKRFITAAKPIRDTKLLPIYAYVKLHCEGNEGIFYKSNGTSFVVFNVSADFKENQTILIEEKTLFGFVEHSSGKEIKISTKGDIVNLYDGARTISCKVPPIEHFPAIQPKDSEESIVMDGNVLSALFLANSHILPPADQAMRAPASFVHLTPVGKLFYIAAWNGMVAYFKSFKEKIPNVSLDPDVISVISKFEILSYSRCGNYDYFDGGGVSYGFIKAECKTPDVSIMVERLKQDVKFTLDRKPLVDFCEMVIDVNSSSVPPIVSMGETSSTSLLMTFTDISENQNAVEKITVTGKVSLDEPFVFQPKNMLTVLKDLGCEKITMSYVQKNMLITSEEEIGYIGSVMGMAKI